MAKAKEKTKKTQAKKEKVQEFQEVSLDKTPDVKAPSEKEFLEMPGAFPDQWTPEKKGEQRMGMLLSVRGVDFGTTKSPDIRKIATLIDSKQEKFAMWESAALRTMFDYAADLLGCWFLITYNGLRKVKGRKQEMKDFTIKIDKKAQDVLKQRLKEVPF